MQSRRGQRGYIYVWIIIIAARNRCDKINVVDLNVWLNCQISIKLKKLYIIIEATSNLLTLRMG